MNKLQLLSRIKPILFTLTLCFFTMFSGFAQNENSTIENEVNEQVYRKFKQSYEARDAETFNSLHTDDMLRINGSGITLGTDYKARNSKRYASEFHGKITIDFSHEHRFYHDDVGYEVGYYKVVYVAPDDTRQISYGRFHLVLKKIDGVWRIAQDWDTDKVASHVIGEAEFLSGTPLKIN